MIWREFFRTFGKSNMSTNPTESQDQFFQAYKKRVYEKLSESERGVIPLTWWDSVIRYYFSQGYSEERTVRIILETMSS